MSRKYLPIKKRTMETTNEITINVQEIEPRLRHETIFKTYEKLREGESLIIHNNHDPKPVYYQLQHMHGDSFAWEYLQQGPEWWDIRVTKEVEAGNTPQQEDHQEGDIHAILINVPALEPSIKHETIFNTYTHLLPGESMVIHNDHDPRPLQYHLQQMHGDSFDWEYLETGPEWWDVLITKKPVNNNAFSQDVSHALSRSDENDIVINIPSLEPKLKHATIFHVFDSLKEGESLVIHNDHDPKPVYYQLLGEHGEVFTWTYLQEGPEWWDIRVTRKGLESSETIGDITAKDWRKAQVFKKYGIDFCCGGKKSVREACAEKGIDATKVEQELQQVSNTTAGGYTNYDEWNLDFLADYVVNTHHQYVRKNIPELMGYASKVARVHGDRHPELLPIEELVAKISKELTEHMEAEEKQLFPEVKKIMGAKNTNTPYTSAEKSFENLVEEMEKEHDSVGRDMDEIRTLSNNYALPEDACASYTLLYKMLDDFENDLHTHIHLENNILFPKTIELEKQLN